MATTFLKRQKEMKRLEKQRAKAERREQRKLEKGAKDEAIGEPSESGEISSPGSDTEGQS